MVACFKFKLTISWSLALVIVDGNLMHLCPTQFGGQTDALLQIQVHQPIKGIQGFTHSHWMPPSVEYLLRITPADKRVACRKRNRKAPYL